MIRSYNNHITIVFYINCKQYLYLYISCGYNFIMLILNKNIYITIFNINMFTKWCYMENALNILYSKIKK